MPEILPITDTSEIKQNTQTGSQLYQRMKSAEEMPKAPVEAAPEAPKPVEKKEEPDPRFLALTKKEKELRQMQRELQEQKKILESKYKPYEEVEALKQTNKLEALKRMGMSYDDITNEFLSQNPMTPEQMAVNTAREIAQKEIAEYKKQSEEAQKTQQQQAFDNAVAQITKEAEYLCNKSSDFPLVKESGAFDTVSSLVKEHFFETGLVMPVEEAITQVEQNLYDGFMQFAKLEKIKLKLMEDSAPKPDPSATPAQEPMKQQTLTHKQTVAPTISVPKNESYEQKKARILAQYTGR